MSSNVSAKKSKSKAKAQASAEAGPPSQELMKDILQLAEQHNTLLKALLNHPKMDQADPSKAPKPLFFVADFVRRTYLEYLCPIMPGYAVVRSSRFANDRLFGYDAESQPFPTDAADEYLNDAANWKADPSRAAKFADAVGRVAMIASCVTDDVMGPMMLQGRFDWVNPVDIKALVRQMMKKS